MSDESGLFGTYQEPDGDTETRRSVRRTYGGAVPQTQLTNAEQRQVEALLRSDAEPTETLRRAVDRLNETSEDSSEA